MSAEAGVLIGIAVAALAVFLVTRPLRERTLEMRADDTSLANLLAEREAAYQVLRDLDNDFQTGKLADDDYRPLRVQALARAAEIVAQIDEHEAHVATALAAVESTRAGDAQRKRAKRTSASAVRGARANAFCPRCGARHAADDAFCRKCGAALFDQMPVREDTPNRAAH